MTTPTLNPRRFRPTPSWLIVALLMVEGLLWLSDRFQWPTWHKGYAVLIAVASVAVVFVVMLLWLSIALLFRLRFQLSIRSLLFAVVVVALPFSWLAVEMKAAREQKAAAEAIEKLGGAIGEASMPRWLSSLLGEDFLGVVEASLSDDAQMECLKAFPELQELQLNSTRITDAGLQHLAGLTQLQEVGIYGTRITNAGLLQLAGLTDLDCLDLHSTQITNAGLRHLAVLSQLRWLSLYDTQITDAGLPQLAGLTKLQKLYLGGTEFTDEGVRKLQQALPNCGVVRAGPLVP